MGRHKDCNESDSCDTSESCYDPFEKPKWCYENKCNNKLRCNKFNIYWFGSSSTDVGNGKCNLGIRSNSIVETPLCEEEVLVNGYGPCGLQSDKKVYPQYLAKDFKKKISLEYELSRLPKERNNLVSFSIAGSTQNNNITANVPSNTYGYDYQVSRFVELYRKARCYTIPEKELFVYTDVGLNTLLELLSSIDGKTENDIIEWFQVNLIQATLNNITRLYNEGKARHIIVQLDDLDLEYLTNVPWFIKYNECIPNLVYIIELYNLSLKTNDIMVSLQDILNGFANSVSNLNLSIKLSSEIYDEILLNSEKYGIINNGKTMIDLGWPAASFPYQAFFDDIHTTDHTNKVISTLVKPWFL